MRSTQPNVKSEAVDTPRNNARVLAAVRRKKIEDQRGNRMAPLTKTGRSVTTGRRTH